MDIPSGKFKCHYANDCSTRRSSPSRCATCENNTKRNFEEDHYKQANDNPIPAQCPRLTYSGPAEQTKGYQCPVCGGFTNPYQLKEGNSCEHCGYRLNVGR